MSKKKGLEIEMVKEKDKRKNSNKIGQKFEDRLQKVFDELREEGICIINKVPTSFKMIRGAGGRVVSCFPEKQSEFLDFQGLIKGGCSICIEAKSCANKTSFPISNFKDYQLPLLKEYMDYGSLGYTVIEMRELKRVFLFQGYKFIEYINESQRKSIPLKDMERIGLDIDYELEDLKTFLKALTNDNK